MKWFLIACSTLAAIALLAVLLGTLTPVEYQATCSIRYPQSCEAVWQVVTDITGETDWRHGVQIEVLQAGDDSHHLRVRMSTPFGSQILEVVESVAPRRFVTRVTAADVGLERTWTYELTPDGDGCRLSILEAGQIKSGINRFFAAWVFGYHGSMVIYLNELGRKFQTTEIKIEKS